MVDTSGGIGLAPRGTSVSGVREAVGREPRAERRAGPVVGSGLDANPNGPRGRRMLSPDTPMEALDRSAPRGTYLDILV